MRHQPPFALSPLALSVALGLASLTAGADECKSLTNGSQLADTCQVTSSASVPANITVASGGGAVDVSQGALGTFTGVISGVDTTSSLTKTGAGTLELVGSNTYTGGTLIEAGTVIMDNNLSLGTGAVFLDAGTLKAGASLSNVANDLYLNGGTIDTGANTTVLSGTVTGEQLTKKGTGTLVLSGVNTYTGDTVINSGTLQIANSNNISSAGVLNLNGGSILAIKTGLTTPSTITLANQISVGSGGGGISTDQNTVIITNTITGSDLVKSGSGTLELQKTIGTLSSLQIQGGQLKVVSPDDTSPIEGTNDYLGAKDSDDGTTAGTHVTLTDATLVMDATVTSQREFTLDGSAATINVASDSSTYTIAGVIDGSGALIKTGAGTLKLSDKSSTGGAISDNTYTGNTFINGGTLWIDSVSKLGAGEKVVMDGGTLQIVLKSTGTTTTTTNTLTKNIEVTGDGGTLDVGATSFTLSGQLSGSGDFHKVGASTVTLSADNNEFAGRLLVDGGVLQISADNNLGGSASSLVLNGGNLRITADSTISHAIALNSSATISTSKTAAITGQISGSGMLTVNGGGVLTLSNNDNNYTGGTVVTGGGTLNISGQNSLGTGTLTLDSGTLQLADKTTLSVSVVLNKTGLLSVLSGNTGTLSGVVADAKDNSNVAIQSSLTKTGDGTLVLSGKNTYSGDTSINAGTIQISSADNLGWSSANTTQSLILSGGTLAVSGSSGTINFDANKALLLKSAGGTLNIDANNSLTVNSRVTGIGALTKSGAGTLSLVNTTNSYSGGTVIQGGVLVVADDKNLGDVSGGITFNGGSLQTSQSLNTSRNIILTGVGTVDTQGASNTTTINGAISGASGLVKQGAGTLVLAGVNAYKGGTTVNQGTLQISSSANLGDSSSGLMLNGATLKTSQSLTLESTRGVALTGAVNILTDDVGNTTSVNGVVSGAGSLTKQGEGVLVLAGANTFSGGTTLTSGVLKVTHQQGLGTGALTLLGGTLNVAADVSLAKALAMTGAATVDVAGQNTFTLTKGLSGSSALTKTGDGQIVFAADSTGYSGSVNLNAGTASVTADNALGAGNVYLAKAATLKLATVNLANLLQVNEQGNIQVASGNTATLSGKLQGAGALIKTGAGALNLTGDNSGFTGQITVSGILGIASDTALGNVAASNNQTITLLQTASLEARLQMLADNIDVAHNVSLVGGGVIDTNGHDTTVTGAVTGSGGLVKTGTGTLELLSSSNTYTGGITVKQGLLAVSNSSSLGDVNNSVTLDGGSLLLSTDLGATRTLNLAAGGGGVAVAANKSVTLSTAIQGVGQFVKTDKGTLILTGVNSAEQGTSIQGGTLVVSNDNQLGKSGQAVHFSNGATLKLDSLSELSRTLQLDSGGGTITSASALTLSGVISGTGDLMLSNASDVTLSAANTYSGNTVISNSQVTLSGSSALGQGTQVTLQDSTLNLQGQALSKNIVLTGTESNIHAAANTSSTISGKLTGTADLNQTGSGTVLLTGDNSGYKGQITIDGTLGINSDAALGDATSSQNATVRLTSTQSTLQILVDGVVITHNLELVAGGTIDTNGHNTTVTGDVQGAGLVKDGDGLLTLQSYSSALTIKKGRIYIIDQTNLSSTINLEGGSLFTLTPQQSGSYTFSLGSGGGGIFVGTNTSVLFTGNIEATATDGQFIKAGNGTLVLSGLNAAKGTAINGGTLVVSADNQLGATGTTVSFNGGTLQINGSNLTNSTRVFQAGTGGGTLITTTDLAIAGLEGSGNFTKQGLGTFTVGSSGGGFTGLLTVSGGQLSFDNMDKASTLKLQNGVTWLLGADAIQNVILDGTSTETLSVATGKTVNVKSLISGTGALTLTGGGTINLTGTNTYTGKTTISNVAVSAATDAALGKGSAVSLVSGSLALGSGFSSSKEFTKTGSDLFTLTGSGTLGAVKVTEGQLTLGASSTDKIVTSGISIANGILKSNASLTGSVTVNNQGVLAGNDNITGAVTVNSGGTVKPGNSPGVVTASSFTFNSGSNLEIEIDGTTQASASGATQGKYDWLSTTGTFTAGGTLKPIICRTCTGTNNTYVPSIGDNFTIVQAGSVTGTFSSISASNLPTNTRLDALYGTNNIKLYITPEKYAALLNSGNAGQIGAALDNNRSSSTYQSLFNSLMPLTATQLTTAMNSFSAGAYAEAAESMLASAYSRSIHFADLQDTTHDQVSVKVVQSKLDADSDGNGLKSTRKRNGVQIGLFNQQSERWTPAMTLAFTQSSSEMSSATDDLGTAELAVGMQKLTGSWQWLVQANVANYNLDVKRNFTVGGTSVKAKASNNRAFGLSADVGYRFYDGLQLVAGVRTDRVEQNSMREEGNKLLALSVNDISADRSSVHAGVMWNTSLTGQEWVWKPSLQLDVEQAFNDDPASVKATFLGQTMTNKASAGGATAVRAIAGVTTSRSETFSLGATAGLEQRDNVSGYAVQLYAQKRF